MHTREKHTRRGFTLIEVAIAVVLLVVAMLGFSRSLVSTMVASDTDREVRAATEAAQAIMERMSGASFADVFALYNEDPTDDPDGAGTAPGPNLVVLGLEALDGDADGCVGRVILPVLDVGGVPEVREDLQLPALGMPRDLNGDDVVDGLDHSGDYTLMPVRVRFDWDGSAGPAHIEFQTVLVGI